MSAPSRPRLRLGRDRRLRSSRLFAELRTGGRRRVCGCLIMNWQAAPNGKARVGVVTSRRVGSAVERSRARRLLREAYRLNQHRIVPGLTMVLVARPSLVGKPFSTVVRDFQRCLREADLLRDRGVSSTSCAASL